MMKKNTILKSLLILFPVLAVGLATTPDSVMVFDTLTAETQYFSYFDVLPVVNLQMVTPMAALLSAFSGILAAVYLAKKKSNILKVSGYAAVASACLAAIPVVVRGDVMVLPNVALPIFMLMQYLISSMMKKAEKEEPKKNNKRLSRR